MVFLIPDELWSSWEGFPRERHLFFPLYTAQKFVLHHHLSFLFQSSLLRPAAVMFLALFDQEQCFLLQVLNSAALQRWKTQESCMDNVILHWVCLAWKGFPCMRLLNLEAFFPPFKSCSFLESWWHFFPLGLLFLTTSDCWSTVRFNSRLLMTWRQAA